MLCNIDKTIIIDSRLFSKAQDSYEDDGGSGNDTEDTESDEDDAKPKIPISKAKKSVPINSFSVAPIPSKYSSQDSEVGGNSFNGFMNTKSNSSNTTLHALASTTQKILELNEQFYLNKEQRKVCQY